MSDPLIRHPDPTAVRANPRRAVADAPDIFLKADIADLKTAWTVMTIRHLLFTTMTTEFLFPSSSAWPFPSFLICHLA